MPGVTVMPSSPGLGGFGSSQLGKRTSAPQQERQMMKLAPPALNGSGKFENLTAADIKEGAIDSVRRSSRGASPMTQVKTARQQYDEGVLHDSNGELKDSLSSYFKAASLVKLAIESPENQKGGVLWNEIHEFWKNAGDLGDRLKKMEERVKAVENTTQNTGEASNKPTVSIADRVKALQSNGLSGISVEPPKRFLRSHSELTPPSSPKPVITRISTPPINNAPGTPTSSSASTQSHTFVPPSSLGPPSPPASPTASFEKSFPSVEELDASHLFHNVPATTDAIKTLVSHSEGIASTSSEPIPVMPTVLEHSLPSPVVASPNPFSNRPLSPTKLSLPSKAASQSAQAPPLINQPSAKPIIPVSGTSTPKDLANYTKYHSVILIDVRSRFDFEREHISSNAILCIEPSLLRRANVTTAIIKEALNTQEGTLFGNRDKFDIVVIYDEDSTHLGPPNSPLATLYRLIGDPKSDTMTKRQPMLLVGGFSAWKQERRAYIESDTSNLPELQIPSAPPLSSRNSSNNPFYAKESYNSAPTQQPTPGPSFQHPNLPVEPVSGHTRSPAEASYPNSPPLNLVHRPAPTRPGSNSISYTRSTDNLALASISSNSYSSGPFTYPSLSTQPLPSSPPGDTYKLPSTSSLQSIASLPQASINPSQLSRKRSDYYDQSQDVVSNLFNRSAIDYPPLPATLQLVQPPPPVASSSLKRQEVRTWPLSASAFPTNSTYQVTYWEDPLLEPRGLRNPSNNCYMNATLQCLNVTAPLIQFFQDPNWSRNINFVNKLGWGGVLVTAFNKLLGMTQTPGRSSVDAIFFLDVVRQRMAQYKGDLQHDSQEFLSMILDVMHEELNRAKIKIPPEHLSPEEEERRENLPMREGSDLAWRTWRMSNDSVIVDLFQGQFQNRMQCSKCFKTSITYNVFSILQLPIPRRHDRRDSVTLRSCLSDFFAPERLDKDDAWDCPRCKRKQDATKQLSLARPPPILLIHLKRFGANGAVSDKIDTCIDFPTKGLDLSPFVRTEPQQNAPSEDPRSQAPPYRYDLYGVTNHTGSLSSGHYVANVKIQGGWKECNDGTVRPAGAVMSERAYVLFYKRTKN